LVKKSTPNVTIHYPEDPIFDNETSQFDVSLTNPHNSSFTVSNCNVSWTIIKNETTIEVQQNCTNQDGRFTVTLDPTLRFTMLMGTLNTTSTDERINRWAAPQFPRLLLRRMSGLVSTLLFSKVLQSAPVLSLGPDPWLQRASPLTRWPPVTRQR